jgi:CHAT domain-containing protein
MSKPLEAFEQLLAQAVIAAYQGHIDASNRLFASLKEMPNSSEFLLPIWRIAVAKKARDWHGVINLNEKLLELNLKENYREDLPSIYLDFASAYFHLGNTPKARENLEKSLAFIEDIRHSENSALSLSLFATFHNAYRLSTQIEMSKPLEAFEQADFLKGRLLKDLISDAARRSRTELPLSVRQKLEALSKKLIENPKETIGIEQVESLVTQTIPKLEITRPDLKQIATNPNLDNTAVISYFFTLDGRLVAFAFQKNQPIKSVYLPVSEDEIKRQASETEQKIKGRIFFKRDGKNLYDQLLAPLNLSAKHMIIVPDKSLWKIPFQALSADGEKYLIEDKIISYAPSISVLLDQLKSPKSDRRSAIVFANPAFENKRLNFVTREARTVASLLGAHAIDYATEADFRRLAYGSDILHFSMHAEVDSEQPLKSFLGMKPVSGADGRLTVEELLEVRLKKGSLVFLASCDTNNIFNGEGLVSLSWGMMGAGASTVISAQWEADDKSTEVFTGAFYRHYKQGHSSAEALQRASLEMIKDKSNNMHEPYYWADFTLNGDFR